MICKVCGGTVRWVGKMSNLTHTKCEKCGGINCEAISPDEDPTLMSEDEITMQEAESGGDGGGR
jgi:hypothetical protein